MASCLVPKKRTNATAPRTTKEVGEMKPLTSKANAKRKTSPQYMPSTCCLRPLVCLMLKGDKAHRTVSAPAAKQAKPTETVANDSISFGQQAVLINLRIRTDSQHMHLIATAMMQWHRLPRATWSRNCEASISSPSISGKCAKASAFEQFSRI